MIGEDLSLSNQRILILYNSSRILGLVIINVERQTAK